MPPTEKESRRFWDKVDKDGPIIKPELGKCWVWIAGKDKYGYGKFSFKNRKVLAHKLSYIMSIGPVPNGLVLDHLCENRACSRPEHLQPVTDKVNLLRGNTAASNHAIKTCCPREHLLEIPNLVPSQLKLGRRSCLSCARANSYLARHDGDHKVISDNYYSKLIMN